MKINIFRKKRKEKWAIQIPKFKQETALNKRTNLSLSRELTLLNSDCNTRLHTVLRLLPSCKTLQNSIFPKNQCEFMGGGGLSIYQNRSSSRSLSFVYIYLYICSGEFCKEGWRCAQPCSDGHCCVWAAHIWGLCRVRPSGRQGCSHGWGSVGNGA